MRSFAKKLTVFALAAILLIMALPLSSLAAGSKTSFTLPLTGINSPTKSGNLFLYTNKTDSVRAIKADEYDFASVQLMVFDKDGRLIECGNSLYVNTPEKNNAPQEYLYIPAGGFALAFTAGADNRLKACFETAMEGGKLYNATMSVIYEVHGSYDEAKKKVTIEYTPGIKPSANAKKFLFVGNSATYFNGTPIKFKALALAAGVETDVVYCTYGAAYLSEFADEAHKHGIALRTALNKTKYDYVVLQDAGAATYEASKPALDVIIPMVRENGAAPLLYMRYSGEKVPENRRDSAKVHYDNYIQLSKDFDITVAPVAESFLICTEKYPEINLYADDKAHHSKEGSYLAACVWLYRYLGIDPRGNTYTAEMNKDTVAKLQECAYLTCEEGYFDRKVKDPEPEESTPAPVEEKSGNTLLICIAVIVAVIAAVIAVFAVLTAVKKKKTKEK